MPVSLAMIGKFGIAASFAVFYVFVGELLPTVLRSQAMGIASFIAVIGLLGFPYIVYLVSEIGVFSCNPKSYSAEPWGSMRNFWRFQGHKTNFVMKLVLKRSYYYNYKSKFRFVS